VQGTDTELEPATWPLFDGLSLRAAVTTRNGGVSTGPYQSLNLGLHVGDDPAAVLENRRRAARSLGLELDDLVFANQVHGRAVAVVDGRARGRGARSTADVVGDVDALVTTTPGIGLVVMVADCVPLVLYSPDAHALAVVHAGWRGTVADVVGATVERLRALGADPAQVLAGIGPAISAAAYEVADDVVAAARATFGPDVDDLVRPDGGGRWRFDLWGASRRLLHAAGVTDDRIELLAEPTGPGTPFFSDRAAHPCGRFAAIATLEPRP
jgi:YfiH family protein